MKKQYQFLLYFLLSIVFNVSGQNIAVQKQIEDYILEVQQQYEVPGISLCVIKGDEVFYKKNFGFANIEHSVPIKKTSIFRVYSLTKPIIAVTVFQLIEQGKLSLEDAISKYIKGLPDSWKDIQVKHLLTHSSGLPDMRVFGSGAELTEQSAKEKAFKESMRFSKGERYDYNQTNFWLLHRIIEKITGEKLADFIAKNQFEGERTNVFFSSDSKQIVKNRVTSYFPFATGTMIIDLPTIEGDYMFAANGLNITLDELVKWDKRLKENKLLKPETKMKMWETFSYTASDKVFGYSWNKITRNRHDSYGFTGSLITAYRIFPKDKLSIFLLSNGLGKIYDIDTVVDKIANIIDKDIYNVQEQTFYKLYQILEDKGLADFKKSYKTLNELPNYNELNLEEMVNSLGYTFLRNQELQKAIQLFTFNTQQYPNSANVYDSLGEAYLIQNELKLAEKNYQKAIALGGTNGNAKEMLVRIQAKKKK
ncbi:serine hydrolase [Tenacibaculum amylolyticum]|uniref:serine hydrolase n=1 Tax=Tenacibaculum amylolyticum TaxID=104269 RepID=UPI0038B54943